MVFKYKCGHESKGMLILDDSPLSLSAYFMWRESVGVAGTMEKCWECWCKERKEK